MSTQASRNAIDIEALWDYADPGLSEERFRAALDTAWGDVRLELLTQIARTYASGGALRKPTRYWMKWNAS